MNATRNSLAASAVMILAATVAAQSQHVSPTGYNDIWAGGIGSSTGPGDNDGRSQYLHVAPIPAGVNVTAIAFRREPGTVDFATYQLEAEIAIADTTLAPGGLVTSFASNTANFTNRTVVGPRQFWNVAAAPVLSSPRDWVAFPTNAPWPFAGPNLVVDFDAFSSSVSSGSQIDVDRCFHSTTAGSDVAFGQSCGTALTDVVEIVSTDNYLPGTTARSRLTAAPASSIAAMFMGLSTADYLGAPLPFELGSIGMPGCYMLTGPIAQVIRPTDASGIAEVDVPIPNNPLLSGGVVAFQWLYADPAVGNSIGLATSRGHLLQIGPRICSSNEYVYTFSGTSSTGSVQGGGPFIRFTTTP